MCPSSAEETTPLGGAAVQTEMPASNAAQQMQPTFVDRFRTSCMLIWLRAGVGMALHFGIVIVVPALSIVQACKRSSRLSEGGMPFRHAFFSD
jgi:hypothetical protein